MPAENADLPLAITPEELEKAEIAVLLDYLRENAAQHDVSDLREQAMAVGYKASVMDQAIADFAEELRSSPRSEPEPARVKEKPRPAVPIPAPPPPRPQTLLEKIAEEEKADSEGWDLSELNVGPWLSLVIVVVNALVLSLAFMNLPELSIFFYSGELALAAVLAANRSARRQLAEQRRRERTFSGLPVESSVAPEASPISVPARPHEVRTETPETPRVPQQTRSRD